MGLFSPFTEAFAAAGLPKRFTHTAEDLARERAAQADMKTIYWFAGEVAERLDISLLEAVAQLAAIASDGGPDLRTRKGWVCASVILGVPGVPVLPTLH